MPPRNLLLCFDAFGTLFKPKTPVAEQYTQVAKGLGLSGFSNDDVAKSFKTAFKNESKQNPNFGKANGMNAEKWWTNIINNTFEPLLDKKQKMPSELVPKLLHRFWCDEGYTLYPDVMPLIHRVRSTHKAEDARVVIGVITNSDDRVPDILTSLGMNVGSRRHGTTSPNANTSEESQDIDFTVMSYDVGHEKPDKRIFAAAEDVLKATLEARGATGEAAKDANQWRKVYVGDDFDKDVKGAVDAGWNAVIIDRETTRGRHDVSWLDPKPPGNLDDTFKSCKAVGFSSLEKLTEWLRPAGS